MPRVDRLRVCVPSCHPQPVLLRIHDDHPVGAEQAGRAGGELTDRPGTPDRHHGSRVDPAQLGGEPTGGGGVRGEERPFVADLVRDAERADIGVRDTDVLGVPTGEPARSGGSPEGAGHGLAVRQLARLRHQVSVVAAPRCAGAALPAGAAGHSRADHHPVADPVPVYLRSHRDDLAQELVPEHIPIGQVWCPTGQEGQIPAAGGAQAYSHDRVVAVAQFRIGYLPDRDPAGARPAQCPHPASPRSIGERSA